MRSLFNLFRPVVSFAASANSSSLSSFVNPLFARSIGTITSNALVKAPPSAVFVQNPKELKLWNGRITDLVHYHIKSEQAQTKLLAATSEVIMKHCFAQSENIEHAEIRTRYLGMYNSFYAAFDKVSMKEREGFVVKTKNVSEQEKSLEMQREKLFDLNKSLTNLIGEFKAFVDGRGYILDKGLAASCVKALDMKQRYIPEEKAPALDGRACVSL